MPAMDQGKGRGAYAYSIAGQVADHELSGQSRRAAAPEEIASVAPGQPASSLFDQRSFFFLHILSELAFVVAQPVGVGSTGHGYVSCSGVVLVGRASDSGSALKAYYSVRMG